MQTLRRSVRNLYLVVLVALPVLSLCPSARSQTYSLGSSALVEGRVAGSDSIVLAVEPATGAWKAVANDGWLHVTAGSASAKGSANVLFSFDANTGSTRTGTLNIAGQTLTITQAGSTYVAAGPLTAVIPSLLNKPIGVAVAVSGDVFIADTDDSALKVYKPATQTVTTLVSSGLSYPEGVAVDGFGNVYITDTANNAVKMYTPATQTVATLISTGLKNPEGLAVDSAGNIYIADTGNNVIKEMVAANGTVMTLVASGLNFPSAVAVDGSGNVYIADTLNNAIKMYTTATGTVNTLVSTGLDEPGGLAVDGLGDVYFSDRSNNAIKEWSPATQTVITLISSGLSSPSGVAVDDSGNIYIGDTGNSAIKEYPAATQTVTTLVAPFPNNPDGVAVDGAGNIYIADTNNNAIEEWSAATQTVTTLIASGLSAPAGLTVDGMGNVYIADTNNNAIEEYTPANGMVTALVSSGLNEPTGVAVDVSGNVYIADSGDSTIKERAAATETVITLVSSGLLHPSGVAVDVAGNVYIADTGHEAIKKWTAATRTVTTVVSAGLLHPSGVAVDASGNLYIADTGDGAVKKWAAATRTVVALISSGLNGPNGVAVDSSGNVFLTDTGDNAIDELPRAFVDPTTISESDAGGSDSLPPILPATVNLLPPFAPTSDQGWLTIGSIGGGLIDFSFAANSGAGQVAHITVLGQSIAIVQGLSPNPIAVDDTAFSASASPVTINVLANDSSPEGDALTVVSVSRPSRGRAGINANNTITYTPAASFATFSGTDSFTYTISDSHGGSASATVTIRNPFQAIKGGYDGLVAYSAGVLTGTPNGYFTLSLTGAGSFTGALKLAGFSYTFIGAFNLDGTAGVSIRRPGSTPITLALTLDEAMGSNLSASISADGNTYAANTGAREPYTATNPAPSAGLYTALLPAPAAPSGTTATASAAVGGGKITGITVTGGGSGYVAPPRVVITGAPGAGALATAVLSGGAVGSITVKTAGARYPLTGTTVTIDPPSAGLAQGTGWATMVVGSSGTVTVVGKLGDGTAFSVGAFLHSGTNGTFVCYAPLYSGTSKPDAPGSIVGTITFEALAGSDCDGTLVWVKPAQTTGALYQSGFATSVGFQGAAYNPLPGAQVLDFTNHTLGAASIELSLGNLATPITQTLSVSNLNAVKVTGSNADRLSLKISAATGTFTGSILAIPSSPTSPISGVVYQKTNVGSGLFIGPSQTGDVQLTPQ